GKEEDWRMVAGEIGTYPPLNTLKKVAEDVWIVDGPVIRFGPVWPRMPFPTRMTVIRVKDAELLVHSPTPLTDELRTEIARIGTVRFIVGPSRLHYWWIGEWHQAYPQAQVHLAPGVRAQAKGRIAFPTQELEDGEPYPWENEIATLAVRGDFLTEL